jgi:hypothetical protein
MTTVQNWVDKTRGSLISGFSEQRNKLASAYTAGSGTMTFTYALGNIQAGARLSIGTNTFYVWSASGATAVVSGGEEGSTDANAAINSIVRVNPHFTDNDIWNALSDDLNDLSSPTNGLYGIGTVDLTYNPVLIGFDLGSIADSVLDVYEIKYLTPGPSHDNKRIATDMWRLNRNANTTSQFPSGFGIQLYQPGYPGYNLRVVYKSVLTMPGALSTNVSVSGLQPSAYDLPPIGAALRLMAGREIKRNFTESQGDTRRATEVPPGAVTQSSVGLARLRQSRISAEAARLDALYPPYRT